MIALTRKCVNCVWSLFLLVIATKDSLQAATNQASSFSFTEDQSTSYFYHRSEYPRDCVEVLGQCSSENSSGVYAIKPDGYTEVFDVYCDNDGYTVIERRLDGLISFSRSWEDYTSGFGFLSNEFWLGNERISYLTNQKRYQLRLDVTLNDGSTLCVTYGSFRISDSHSDYTLISTGQYNGINVTCPSNMSPGLCTCQRSCADPNTCSPSNCHVTGSCICPSGLLMNDGHCIPQNECGCFIDDSGQGAVLQEGGIYISPNCDRKCSCTSGRLNCENDFRCSSHGSCEQRNDRWNCSCNSGYEGDGVICTRIVTATDCQDIYDDAQANRHSGLYNINPGWSSDPVQVYCNMEDGGGWTVIQRQDGSENFYRNWTDYRDGFGSPDGGMWLGNEKIHHLTNQKEYELRIDLTDRNGRQFYATYNSFSINDESDKYRLSSVGSFSGNTGYSYLHYHVNKQFSTYDQDNDGWSSFDCAEEHQGGWWFYYYNYDYTCYSTEGYCDFFQSGSYCHRCAYTHLNANYNSATRGRNIFWSSLSGYDCGLQYTEMRIRPV